jgi:hypothetical protein
MTTAEALSVAMLSVSFFVVMLCHNAISGHADFSHSCLGMLELRH